MKHLMLTIIFSAATTSPSDSQVKISFDKFVIANLNEFKREFVFLAASLVILFQGAGEAYTPKNILNRINYAFGRVLPTEA